MESHPLPNPELIASSDRPDVDVLVVAMADDLNVPAPLAELGSDGWIDRLIDGGQLRGKKGEVTLLAGPDRSGPGMILVIGIGPAAEMSPGLAFDTAATTIRKITDRPYQRVRVALASAIDSSSHCWMVAGLVAGCEGQGIYQSEQSIHVPVVIEVAGVSEPDIRRGQAIGEAINCTRRLVNEPPAIMYPQSFAEQAVELGRAAGLEVEVWDEDKLAAEGCRAMLAVGSGSDRKPRLVRLQYNGGGDEPPIALVGKGVTFDSGGLSLKPSESMADMKCDMAGAATVVGVLCALAKLRVKQNVIGFCGLAENMVSGSSYKLGDVIETRSGKTIEILNTDAEGRVVLSDTLDVAIGFQPSAIVDLATLTGACMVALGREVAGLMTNDQALCDQLIAAAGDVGEPVWQLPMFELYDEKVKSLVADIKNIGEGRWGGAITAAKFLENFVGDAPWVHIDIAGPAFADSAKPSHDAGATGTMVRTLLQWIESRSS